jgi:hypothetical protein
MADTKISGLPASTTPLAGTEVLPIVQGGVTRQVSVANLTAGRAISATELTLTTDNLIIGTSGKGIDFSATPGTGTSELLSDYEEGTWTPTVVGSSTAGTASYSTQNGTYTKVGRMVYFQCELIWSAGSGSGSLRIAGLPFTCGGNNCSVSVGDLENVALTALFYVGGAYVFANSTQISLRECAVGGGGNNPVAYDAAGTIRVGGCYYV